MHREKMVGIERENAFENWYMRREREREDGRYRERKKKHAAAFFSFFFI